MRKKVMTLVCLIIFALHGIVQAQDERNKNNQPDFSTWTEEQIRHWEDSIRKAIYPDLELQTTKGNNDPRREDPPTPVIRGNNTYVPNSINIDTTRPVGEIPMTSAVSPTGAITYNIPIEIYPCRQSVQPQLSIVYSSQSGNGILGMGWGVGGLSSIFRGNRSLYYDERAHGVNMTKEDAFYLNGMRLIKISETSTLIKYESERDIWVEKDANARSLSYFNNRLSEDQRKAFTQEYPGKYNDFKFFHYGFFSFLHWYSIIEDITYSD